MLSFVLALLLGSALGQSGSSDPPIKDILKNNTLIDPDTCMINENGDPNWYSCWQTSVQNTCMDSAPFHVPVLTRNPDSTYTLSLHHPAIKGHYIEWVWVEDETGRIVFKQHFDEPDTSDETWMADVNFSLSDNYSAALIPFIDCNIHGGWSGEPLIVGDLPVHSFLHNNTHVSTDSCTVDPSDSEHYSDVDEFFSVTSNAGPNCRTVFTHHVPMLTAHFNGSYTYEITNHPMIDTHYFKFVWVENELGEVVWAKHNTQPCNEQDLGSPIRFSFELPPGMHQILTPKGYCNTHGAWEGDSIQIGPPQLYEMTSMNRYMDMDTPCVVDRRNDAGEEQFDKIEIFDANTDLGSCSAVAGHHQPELSINPYGDYHFTVNHPQQEPHYLDFLIVSNENGSPVWWKYLAAPVGNEDNPGPVSFDFDVEGLHESFTPFLNCNQHGFWTNLDELYVGQPNTTAQLALNALVDKDSCMIDPDSRKQYGKAEVFTKDNYPGGSCGEGDMEHHVPALVMNPDGQTVTITVPHPQTNDHFLDYLWVTDDSDTIVWWKKFSAPTEEMGDIGVPWSFVFTPPTGTSSLTPWENCNLHGIWKGDSFDVGSLSGAKAPKKPIKQII